MQFDSLTTYRILQKLSDRQRRILALPMSAGWQSNGVIALWNSQHDPDCPWCEKYDTTKHQVLECPKFQESRQQHCKLFLTFAGFPSRFIRTKLSLSAKQCILATQQCIPLSPAQHCIQTDHVITPGAPSRPGLHGLWSNVNIH